MVLDNWAIFQIRFNEKYPDFASAMLTQHHHLTQQDLIILSAIYVNLNTHQISAILGISPDSVRKSKYRLKKKIRTNYRPEIDFAHSQITLNAEQPCYITMFAKQSAISILII